MRFMKLRRLRDPGSERAIGHRPGERSASGELPGADFETMGPMCPYRASDAPMAPREAIRRHFFETIRPASDRHPVRPGQHLLRGRGRRRRPDADGYVGRFRVFAGNMCGHRTPAGMPMSPVPRGRGTRHRRVLRSGPHRTLRGAFQARHLETGRPGPAAHRPARGLKPGPRPVLRHHTWDRSGRTTCHRRPLLPTAVARFDGGPSGRVRPRTKRPDWDGATPWRTRNTPTGIGAVFSSPHPNPAGVPSVAANSSGPKAAVHHRHRPPTGADDLRPPARSRSLRRLGRPPPDPGRSATRHRRLPAQ